MAKDKGHFVVELHISRHYGGPEEGGWWFDWRDVERVHTLGSRSAAKRKLAALKENQIRPRYGRGSVLGGTDVEFVRARSLQEVNELQSRRRPRYE